jgi:hypothetical protein
VKRLSHQLAPPTSTNYLWSRTTAIYIDNISARLFNHHRGIAHPLYVVPEYLNPDRPLHLSKPHHLKASPTFAGQPLN